MLRKTLIDQQLRVNLGSPPRPITMSDYFPHGTHYFYGYPAGEATYFFNSVPPTVEELVAARANMCAGPKVGVINFAATTSPEMDNDLLEDLEIPQAEPGLTTLLPKEIDINLYGSQRNEAIMSALAQTLAPGSLVMAQPFIDDTMAALYQIPAKLSIWINDKNNMEHYIDPKYIPHRYAHYDSGSEFVRYLDSITLPCVIKVSSSSSGDGVYICHTEYDVEEARRKLKNFEGKILIERYIDIKQNYGVHFGIPHDTTKPIDIIGYNQQLTNDQGEFLGGRITSTEFPPELDEVKNYLLDEVLPRVREMGWYGVGGLDVILDQSDEAYIIDCNFRMTGMSAYHFLVSKGTIGLPLVSFMGEFNGSRSDIERQVLQYFSKDSKQKIGQLIAMSHHGDRWYFNGALFYDSEQQLKQRIGMLLQAGVESEALKKIQLSD